MDFDPQKAATFETDWWKAHHNHDKEALVVGLMGQEQEVYGLTEADAHEAVQFLAVAIKAHDDRNFQGAEESMQSHYEIIKRALGRDFDTNQAAKQEIAWWEIHDSLEFEYDKTRLDMAFAELYATILGVSPEQTRYLGELRTLATYEHDLAEDPLTHADRVEFHWNRVRFFLRRFYEELLRISQG